MTSSLRRRPQSRSTRGVISLDAGMRRHDDFPPEGGGFTDPLFETLNNAILQHKNKLMIDCTWQAASHPITRHLTSDLPCIFLRLATYVAVHAYAAEGTRTPSRNSWLFASA
jgi:hypothetical protein